MRGLTQARIGLRRSGNALSSADVLQFQAARAAARDAGHTPMDADGVVEGLRALGLGDPVVVTSQASSRAEYLRRPDLGRVPEDLEAIEHSGADIGFVIADGLSATAVDTHAVTLVETIDHIGEALGVDVLLVIIGERPGLSVADSLGIYLTYRPERGRRDSERNCISNIHPPDGLGYRDAARIVGALVVGARALGASGVALKDTSSDDPAVAEAAAQGELG